MVDEEQIKRLLDELYELRVALSEMSRKASRMEAAVKQSFPKLTSPRELIAKRDRITSSEPPTLSGEQALAFFEELRTVVSAHGVESGIRKLDSLSISDLNFLSKELGVAMGKGKPSRRKLANEILGRVRQSIMLRQHTPVARSEN